MDMGNDRGVDTARNRERQGHGHRRQQEQRRRRRKWRWPPPPRTSRRGAGVRRSCRGSRSPQPPLSVASSLPPAVPLSSLRPPGRGSSLHHLWPSRGSAQKAQLLGGSGFIRAEHQSERRVLLTSLSSRCPCGHGAAREPVQESQAEQQGAELGERAGGAPGGRWACGGRGAGRKQRRALG